MSLLLTSNSDLRTGPRFVVYIAIFAAGLFATGSLFSIVAGSSIPVSELLAVGLNGLVSSIAALAALFFMGRFVDHVPISVYGVAFHEGWLGDVLKGAGIAGAMLLGLLGGAALAGHVDMRWVASASSLAPLSVALGTLLVAAAFEELLFRGYLLQVLLKGIGAWPAILVMSILFGSLHLGNPGATLLSTLNTVLAGVLLSAAYMRTRSLWLPYAIHAGWNIGLGIVAGFPLSGLNIASLWTTHVAGSRLMLGSDYGPEGGLIGTLIFGAGLLALQKIRQFHVSAQVQSAIDANPEKVYAIYDNA